MKPFIFAILTLFQTLHAQEKPPNVLVLYADDWRFNTLGIEGNEVVKTPVLDEFARQNVRFKNSYVTTAICGVSRASLFTGQWMSRHGNKGFAMFTTPWSETYPGLMRENGYYVGHIGKWHNGKFPAEHFDFGRSYAGTHWMKDENGKRIHVTAKNEKDSLEFLKTRPTNKPFLLTVAFFATHAEDSNPKQFLPQPQSMKLYKDITVPVPENATQESWERLPDFFTEKNAGRKRWHWRFDTPGKFQTMMKNYYRLASEVDATCGVIMKELEKEGLLDSTLIIFSTDNGYYHAEHGLADKWYPHEESIRVPLIIHDPRRGKMPPAVNENLVLNVDLAPTILAAVGIEAPKNMQGRDLFPLLLGKKVGDWRTEYFYEHAIIFNKSFIPASEALVRLHEKYFFWPDYKAEQLFDLKTDPHEENDLIADPAQKDHLIEMRERFLELKKAAK